MSKGWLQKLLSGSGECRANQRECPRRMAVWVRVGTESSGRVPDCDTRAGTILRDAVQKTPLGLKRCCGTRCFVQSRGQPNGVLGGANAPICRLTRAQVATTVAGAPGKRDGGRNTDAAPGESRRRWGGEPKKELRGQYRGGARVWRRQERSVGQEEGRRAGVGRWRVWFGGLMGDPCQQQRARAALPGRPR